jgi:hypothetical protein
MQANLEPRPLTKQQAEQISNEWLATARELNAPLRRGSIRWRWVLPAWVIGLGVLIYGIHLQRQLIEGLGLALALVGTYMALRPIEGLADVGAKLSAMPSQRLMASIQLLSGAIVVGVIVYFKYWR